MASAIGERFMERTQSVYLLCHGQSTFNAAYALTGIDPYLIDAQLSELGRQQIAAVSDEVSQLNIELIVTSPLTRCLETATLLVNDAVPPIVIQPLLRERLFCSCDVGRHPDLLTADFPHLDFSHLDPVWWYFAGIDQQGVSIEPLEQFEQRVADFCLWLSQRPETSILVVGHADFFAHLIGVKLSNGELRHWTEFVVV